MLNRTSPRNDSSSVRPAVEEPLVLIVDDDARVREGLNELILSAGMTPVCFASTRELLNSGALEKPGCLILDVRMPGASGLDLQHQLAASGNPKPIIFLTGHGDIPMTVQAMKLGAVDFLTKPVRDQTLLDAVVAAIERDVAQEGACDCREAKSRSAGVPDSARARSAGLGGPRAAQQTDRLSISVLAR